MHQPQMSEGKWKGVLRSSKRLASQITKMASRSAHAVGQALEPSAPLAPDVVKELLGITQPTPQPCPHPHLGTGHSSGHPRDLLAPAAGTGLIIEALSRAPHPSGDQSSCCLLLLCSDQLVGKK